MNAAKAFFSVSAGMLLDEPMPEHSRQWGYTSQDYEADKSAIDEMKSNGPYGTKFMQCRTEATAYANGLIDPSRVNWVRLEFVWV